jgi:uncharacterized protein
MGKLLFWVAVVAVAYFAFKLIAVSQRKSERAADRDAKRATKRGGGGAAGEPMRQCAHCGVHLPASDAVSSGGRDYCSEAHSDAGPAR